MQPFKHEGHVNKYLNTQFLPHREHSPSPLHKTSGYCCLGK
jgi:hypothetical protein